MNENNEEDLNLVQCKYCGELIPSDSLTCPSCGERLRYDYKKIGIIAGITFAATLVITGAILFLEAPKKVDLPDKQVSALDKGISLYEEGNYSDAEDEFNKAISESKDPEAYFYLGKIKEKDNDMAEAILNYEESLRINPLNKKLKPHLVNLCIDQEDYECVSEFVTEAYGEDPSNSKIALQYAISGNLTNEEMFNILKKIPSTDVTEYYYANKILGYHYAYYDEYKTAIPYLQRAYNLRNKNVESGRIEEFLNNNYSSISSSEHEGHLLVGSYVALEQYSNAIKLLDEMIKASGDPDLINLRDECKKLKVSYDQHVSYEKQQSSSASSSSTTKLKPKISSSGDWSSYLRNVEAILKRNWVPYKSSDSYSVTVKFRVNEDGYPTEYYVINSSGIAEADDQAEDAVRKSVFHPLPSWYSGSSVPIEFKFDYNVR